MIVEHVDNKLVILPTSNREAIELGKFMTANTPETLVENIVFNVGINYRELAPAPKKAKPKKEAPKQEEAPKEEAPEGELESMSRPMLVERCKLLGIEVLKGVRAKTLVQMIKDKEAEPKEDKPEPTHDLTHDQVKELCKVHLAKYKGDSLKKVFEQFGARSLSQVDEAKYPELVAALTEEAEAMEML